VQPVPPSISEAWPTRMPSMSVMALSIRCPLGVQIARLLVYFPAHLLLHLFQLVPIESYFIERISHARMQHCAEASMPTVATGTPLGICTMDSRHPYRGGTPLRGIPNDGKGCVGSDDARQMGGKAGSRNESPLYPRHGRFFA